MAKPTDTSATVVYPDWATGELIQPAGTSPADAHKIVTPDGSVMTQGYSIPSKSSPVRGSAQEFNYLFRTSGQWIRFLYDDLLSQQHNDDGTHKYGFSVEDGAGGGKAFEVTATELVYGVPAATNGYMNLYVDEFVVDSGELFFKVLNTDKIHVTSTTTTIENSNVDITATTSITGTSPTILMKNSLDAHVSIFEIGSSGSGQLAGDSVVLSAATTSNFDLTRPYFVGTGDATNRSSVIHSAGTGAVSIYDGLSTQVAKFKSADIQIGDSTVTAALTGDLAIAADWGGTPGEFAGISLDGSTNRVYITAFDTVQCTADKMNFVINEGTVDNQTAIAPGASKAQFCGQSQCRGWVQFNFSTITVSSSATLVSSFNIASIVVTGTSPDTIRITFSNAMNSTNYVCSVSGIINQTAPTKTTGYIDISAPSFLGTSVHHTAHIFGE